ncbi:hypothetical protein [Streptomyces sp. NPDC001070]
MGYTGSANLLIRYINQGRVEADHTALSPRRVTRLLVTPPRPPATRRRQCPQA